MANEYYDSQLTDAQIEAVLEAIYGLIQNANNGKVVAIENATLAAKSVMDYLNISLGSKTITQNGTYDPGDDNLDGYDSVTVNVSVSPTLQSKNVTPSASQQTVQPDSGYDGLSAVIVAGDVDLVAGNIKKNVEIFGVTGSYEGSAHPNLQAKTVTQNGTVTADAGYDGLSSVIVNVSSGGGGLPLGLATGGFTLSDLTLSWSNNAEEGAA